MITFQSWGAEVSSVARDLGNVAAEVTGRDVYVERSLCCRGWRVRPISVEESERIASRLRKYNVRYHGREREIVVLGSSF